MPKESTKISFGTGKDLSGYGDCGKAAILDPSAIEGVIDGDKALRLGGWNLRASAGDGWKDALAADDAGVYLAKGKERYAMVLRIPVPAEGTYRVRVTLRGPKDPVGAVPGLTLYAGRRNVIRRNVELAPGEEKVVDFTTLVAPYIPALTSVPFAENAIYISITGAGGIARVEFRDCIAPVIWVAGDSTLTDQNAPYPYYPLGSCAGWAQAIAQYFNDAAVCNQAHSGMTGNCFRQDGHWDIVEKRIKAGDVFLMQFGHNDQKRRNLQAYGGYLDNLRWYCTKVKEKGAFPVILSPISRIPGQDERGRWISILKLHAQAARTAAEECDVPFIDLHAMTLEKWCNLGQEKSHDYFNPGDITHTNDYGAQLISEYVVTQIAEQEIEPLVGWLGEGWKAIVKKILRSQAANSANRNAIFGPEGDTRELPKEPAGPDIFAKISMPYIDLEGVSTEDKAALEKCFRGGMFDPCVMHLHPQEPMPRAQLMMVLFKALRISKGQGYCGKYCDISPYEWDTGYIQACVERDLVDPSTVSWDRFRPDDDLTVEEFADFLIRGLRSVKPEALGEAAGEAPSLAGSLKLVQKLGLLPEKVAAEPKRAITRAELYISLGKAMDMLHSAQSALPSDVEMHPVH